MSENEQKTETQDTPSVNIMFAGVYESQSFRYDSVHDFMAHAINSCVERPFSYFPRDRDGCDKVLSDTRRSVSARYVKDHKLHFVECCFFSEGMSDCNEKDRLLMRQAKHALGVSDFTVVNIEIVDDNSMKIARALAEMTGGVIVENWKDEEGCSFVWPDAHKIKEPVTQDSEINVLVMPNGWTHLDTLSLLYYVVKQKALDGECLMSTLIPEREFAETGIKMEEVFFRWKEIDEVSKCEVLREECLKIVGEKNITVSAWFRARVLLSRAALISGGLAAYGFKPSLYLIECNREIDDFHSFDVTSIGAETIPSLDDARIEVMKAFLPLNYLSSMASDVVDVDKMKQDIFGVIKDSLEKGKTPQSQRMQSEDRNALFTIADEKNT